MISDPPVECFLSESVDAFACKRTRIETALLAQLNEIRVNVVERFR